MSADSITSASALVGGGFFGGLLNKVVKVVAVIGGIFIAGLAYLQYQQIATFDWNRIEVLACSALVNVTSQITNNQEEIAFSMSNFGIPLCQLDLQLVS